ncbi:RNA-directed DNA polymerase, eukaryota, reverse transcriptase zinc-binding domain protein [Tanacetum coccineum]
MSIQLADRSIKYPIRVCENLLVKVSKFIFPVDFVVLEMDEDELVPGIFGRPFLATERAVIDVYKGKLSLGVESETIIFNIEKSMKSKHSRNDYLYCADHTVKLVQEKWVDTVNHDGKWTKEEEEEDSNKALTVSFYLRIEPELPEHLEYAFLQENNQLLVAISSILSTNKKTRLLVVLQNNKGAIAWSIADIKGFDSSFCTHKILMEDEFKPSVQPQRRVNLNIKEVVKKEVIKLLDAGLIYPISDSPWMLERLAGHEYYCFLDGFFGYFKIPIAPKMNGLRNMQFPRHFSTLHIENNMEVFMDYFSVFGSSFDHCLKNLEKMLKRCEETNLILNWEKCHFMVKEGIVLVHNVSGSGIEVDKAKIKAISKLPYPMNVIAIRSFLGHPGFYRSDYVVGAKELLAVVFAFDKFRQYLVLSKTIVFTDHSALRYLFIKQHAKPLLIQWILLLQEFNTEIHDKKGAENLAADHLSRLEHPDLGKLTRAEIRDLFPEERLMAIFDKNNEPWYTDYANYLASRILPFRSTRQEKQNFFSDLRYYFWDEPFLFKQRADRIIRRRMARDEASQILRQCHSRPSGRHHGIATTARKVFEARFYWPHIFYDARKLVQVCDACQQARNISSKIGGNSSFIAIIPKTFNAKLVKDFRPISLIGRLYKIIAKILANRLVFVMGDLVNEVQSAFIDNRNILDGPFILNEVMQWSKAKKKQTMIFKVDFEKAFDSVRWDFLVDVLKKFGFGDRWCNWIKSCLCSSRGSILVNGSPTSEFQFQKGLKQGDPLSPFLFILVMESLHLSFQKVVNAGMFKGVILDNSLQLSHLFYADDVVFLGQWCESNLKIIVQVLECFFRASGLRINMHKSKIMGVAVENSKVSRAAADIGCMILKAPFSYLGVKIGDRMSRVKAWDEIINKLLCRLSKWKLKTLSIGGRLTLLKSVLGSLPIYYLSMFKVPTLVLNKMESIRSHFFNGVELNDRKISMVKWESVLVSKEKGGLGVSSFFALNRALIFKWVWRFQTQRFSLWSRVIKAIHGEDGKLSRSLKYSYSSNWKDIVREVSVLKEKGLDLYGFIRKKIGNGDNTMFWEENWKEDIPLKLLFPRIYALELDKHISVASKLSQPDLDVSFRRKPRGGAEQDQMYALRLKVEGHILSNSMDRWFWSLTGSGEFSVASIRNFIDDQSFKVFSPSTRWNKAVPKKINIMAWKVKMNNLPTRFNLSRRGLNIESILCPICNLAAETSCHLFFKCCMVKDIYKKIESWWDINMVSASSYEEWCIWFSSLRLSSKAKLFLEGVFFITWWSIWRYRNKIIFGSSSHPKSRIMDDIMASSFSWCRFRCNSNFSNWFSLASC